MVIHQTKSDKGGLSTTDANLRSLGNSVQLQGVHYRLIRQRLHDLICYK